jgi:hypothetical protein
MKKFITLLTLFVYVWIRAPFCNKELSADQLKKKMTGWLASEEKSGYVFVGYSIGCDFLFRKGT